MYHKGQALRVKSNSFQTLSILVDVSGGEIRYNVFSCDETGNPATRYLNRVSGKEAIRFVEGFYSLNDTQLRNAREIYHELKQDDALVTQAINEATKEE